jgi:hydroxyacylglutathione hydrolase
VLLKRFYHDGLAQASYLVGCQRTGEALVVDANRDIGAYLDAAEVAGMRITHVTETHIHADYLSGSRELAATAGAQLFLSAEGGQDWQYHFARDAGATYLQDGDVIVIGEVRVEAMHTPGHTPEHLTFLVTDTVASQQPVGALTGDFVFVGDVGRPDLLERAAGVEGTMRTGAKLLFESLRRFTERCPDYLQLWPGHGAGSACGKSLGAVPQTTLGYEKLTNWAFQIDREEPFVDAVLDGQPDPPTYFATMKRMNRDGPPQLGSRPVPAHHAAADLAQVLARGGDVVIDVRRLQDFATAHVPGTIAIPFNRGFVGYAGWILPYDRDVYLLTGSSDDALARSAAMELAMIGIDRVTGWFDSEALPTWTSGGNVLASLETTSATEAADRQREGARLVDVRTHAEWQAGRPVGATHVPLGRLTTVMRDEPRDQRILLLCESGVRSAIGASMLQGLGFEHVANVGGGMEEWRAAALPVEVDAPALTAS